MVEEKKVDDEWKQRAQKEKVKASEQAQQTKAPLPPVSFGTFVSGLGVQALMAMGQMENPVTHKKEIDLDQAKYLIDTIQMLKEKTKGNLKPDEDKSVEGLLYNLQMGYVKVSQSKKSELNL